MARVSDVFLASYQPNNDLDADLISDLRDLRAAARKVMAEWDGRSASCAVYTKKSLDSSIDALRACLPEAKP
jgi:hypothetical protein